MKLRKPMNIPVVAVVSHCGCITWCCHIIIHGGLSCSMLSSVGDHYYPWWGVVAVCGRLLSVGEASLSMGAHCSWLGVIIIHARSQSLMKGDSSGWCGCGVVAMVVGAGCTLSSRVVEMEVVGAHHHCCCCAICHGVIVAVVPHRCQVLLSLRCGGKNPPPPTGGCYRQLNGQQVELTRCQHTWSCQSEQESS